MKISVIIATYNRVDLLQQQMRCLRQQSIPREQYEIIVINDGSTDGTPAYLADLARQESNITVLEQANQGPAAARNLGATQARGAILAFTDDDCLADPGWLRTIQDTFADPAVLAAQGCTYSDPTLITPLTHQVINEQGDTSIPTCNAAYRRTVFTDAGGFDAGFPFQNEDADLAWRVREMGEVRFVPTMRVYHPPRVDSFRKNCRKMQHYVSEFMLFHKSPARYRKYRFASPWVTIYWRIAIKAQGFHFLRRVKYLRQPGLMIQGIALSLWWWFDLLRKLPVFWRADRYYRRWYAGQNKQLVALPELVNLEKPLVGNK